jgi:hypothetical protein
MMERLPPEAIRGSWYFLPESADPHGPADKGRQLYRFRLDGTFSRYILKGSDWSEKEEGDYTFDGAFLIIRGRNTDTYRVRPEGAWKWNLEGKKEDQKLMRGLMKEDDFFDLSDKDAKEIRILPIRATVEAPAEHDDVVYDLMHTGEAGHPRRIGSFFVERSSDGKIWVGLTRFASGLQDTTWERIIRESFLDIFLGKPSDVTVVTVRLLDTDESRVFNYSV